MWPVRPGFGFRSLSHCLSSSSTQGQICHRSHVPVQHTQYCKRWPSISNALFDLRDLLLYQPSPSTLALPLHKPLRVQRKSALAKYNNHLVVLIEEVGVNLSAAEALTDLRWSAQVQKNQNTDHICPFRGPEDMHTVDLR